MAPNRSGLFLKSSLARKCQLVSAFKLDWSKSFRSSRIIGGIALSSGAPHAEEGGDITIASCGEVADLILNAPFPHSFSYPHCEECNDIQYKNAEHRFRMIAFIGDETPGNKLPLLINHEDMVSKSARSP